MARTRAKKGNKKERVRRAKKNVTEEERGKPLAPTRVTDALIRDEEQTGKKKKDTVSGHQPQVPWTIRSPPTTPRDHMVSLFL